MLACDDIEVLSFIKQKLIVTWNHVKREFMKRCQFKFMTQNIWESCKFHMFNKKQYNNILQRQYYIYYTN